MLPKNSVRMLDDLRCDDVRFSPAGRAAKGDAAVSGRNAVGGSRGPRRHYGPRHASVGRAARADRRMSVIHAAMNAALDPRARAVSASAFELIREPSDGVRPRIHAHAARHAPDLRAATEDLRRE